MELILVKPRAIASVLLCTATLMSVTAPTVTAVAATSPVQTTAQASPQAALPTPFADIKMEPMSIGDYQGQFKTFNKIGNPIIARPGDAKKDSAIFIGNTAFAMPVSQDQYNQMSNGMAIETYFKYNEGAPLSGEHDIFSNQQGGGVGLGVDNGNLTFFAHVDGQYRQPHVRLTPGKWVHAVGVVDKADNKAKLYVNGRLVDAVSFSRFKMDWPTNAKAHNFVLGGDSNSAGGAESFMSGQVQTARLYNHSLTANDAAQLSNAAQGEVAPEPEVQQSFDSRLVGPSSITAGHVYNLNVQMRQNNAGDINKLEYDVNYDANLFDFIKTTNQKDGYRTRVTLVKPGQLHISTSSVLSSASYRQFSQTKIAALKLRAKKLPVNKSAQTSIDIKDAVGTINGKKVDNLKMTLGTQAVKVIARASHDYNGDGIVGAGDIAMAPADQREAVAKEAVIRPYKHVVVLTTDGGGNPWDPSGMYYAKDNSVDPKWTTNPEILKKRRNKYTMDLFNKKFAMSTSASAVIPTISAQNYISMLHGVTWGELPTEYQGTNATTGGQYFADFDKAKPLFPSVFKVLQAANPYQSAAEFSEWTNILNGITEPEAAVDKNSSRGWESFNDVANYIGTEDFNNTALTYMQSDQMDHQGHTKGWFNDNYWDNYAKYDDMFKTVMDKLEKTGHAHDTLVIANADHGGWKLDHGQNTERSNTNIFIGIGGETIDSGRRLKGGSNADISALILHALQVKKPSSMTGKVFDSSAFLDQTQLTKKHRDVEDVTLKANNRHAQLHLKTKATNQLRSLDTRIDLAGRTVDQITTPAGTKILRQEVKDGILSLTLGFDKQPTADALANIKFAKTSKTAKNVTIQKAMAGTDKGQEILVDLHNEATPNESDNNNNGNGNNDHKPTPQPEKPGKPEKPNHSGNDTNKPAPKPDQNQGTDNTLPTPGTSDHHTGNTDKPHHGHGSADKTETKGRKWYAMKKIGFYKGTHFTKHNLMRWFKATKQQKWAQFSFLKRVHSKSGYRYQVKDLNKGSKTFGKIGYITTNKRYVTVSDYTKKPKYVKVIRTKGITAFRNADLTQKAKHYRTAKTLKVKALIKQNGHVRLQLTNGLFITADKHDIKALNR